MKTRDTSLVTRVARSAALAASVSALMAAVAASLLGAFLLQKEEDRRLFEAARDLDFLLGDAPVQYQRIAAVVRHEHEETEHAGIRFTVRDASGSFIAGDPHLESLAPDECSTRRQDRLRICSIAAVGPVSITASSVHTPQTLLFSLATLGAFLASGLVTWFWSRPMARSAVAPLSRLRSRVAAIDVDLGGEVELGPVEHVTEVDELRATIGQLLQRVGVALEQAQRFAANAAHELRTPLTAVRAELELFGESPAAGFEVGGNLSAARAKVAELVTLVEKLLVLSSTKLILDEPNEIVSLRDVMEDVVHGLEPELVEKVALTQADALVRGDSVLLASMFANGVANALKFGKTARVDLAVVDGEAAITIDDDGPGLDRADWERVFEPFYRGEGARRLRRPGHGLGLALVRHIAESHGGSACFTERDGAGARLRIVLPQMVV